MKSIITRTISGIFLIIIVIGAIWINSFTNFLLFGAILLIGQWEFYKLVTQKDNMPNSILGLGISSVVYILSYAIASKILPFGFFALTIPLFFSVLISELYRKKTKPITNIALTFLGILYTCVPLSTVHFMVLDSHLTLDTPDFISAVSLTSPFNLSETPIYYANFILIGFFMIQWVSDTGAYLAGMTFGKHRLFERISPKKSWEGAIGGFVASVAVSFLVHYFFPALRLTDWVVISLIITFFGIYGDLVESLMKRSVNIKDSGSIMPGHGGILDRFDSSLMALPMVFFYLKFIYYF